MPVAIRTPLGWTCVDLYLPSLLLREQGIESLGIRNTEVKQLSQEEILAISKVEKSRRCVGGRIPNTREDAEKCLYSLKSLLKKGEFAQRYKDAMNANINMFES